MKGLYSDKEVTYRVEKVYSTRWLSGERLENYFKVYPDGTLEIQSLEQTCTVRLLNDSQVVSIEYLRLTSETKVKIIFLIFSLFG